MTLGRRRLAVAGSAITLLCVITGVGVYVAEPPSVGAVETSWGVVTPGSSQILVRVPVDNPNPVGVPRIIAIGYTVSLNDIIVADGVERGVGIPRGASSIAFTVGVDNDLINDWFVTHVARDERSTMTIESRVIAPFGVTHPLETQRQEIQTDMVSSMVPSDQDAMALGDDPFLVVEDQTAAWGTPTIEELPVTVRTTLRNAHANDIAIDGLGYSVRMNDVVLGEGEIQDAFRLAPGERGTLLVPVVLDTPRIVDRGITHIRNGERTAVSIDVFATVEVGGAEERVRLSGPGDEQSMETDLLAE